MLELGVGTDIVRGIGLLFWLLFLGALALVLGKAKTTRRRVICTTVVLLIFLGPLLPDLYRAWDYKTKYAKAKALFDERCKSAGQKIYRTVDDVRGVLLVNVRSDGWAERTGDQNWPDAGLAKEYSGDAYIGSFLSWEQNQDKRYVRGYLNQTPSDYPGYRYVEVESAHGLVSRYRYKKSAETGYWEMQKEEAKAISARYAVLYKNLPYTSDRRHWVAGVKVSVVDVLTSEILAEATWFSFEPGLGSRAGGRQPWLLSLTCPDLTASSDRSTTRFFVDQVLKPSKGD